MNDLLPEEDRDLARRLRDAIEHLGLDVRPGGQCRTRTSLLWSPTDPDDWHAGGPGDLCPRLRDDANAGVLLGMLRALPGCARIVVRIQGAAVVVQIKRRGRLDNYSGLDLGHAAASALLACLPAPTTRPAAEE